MTGARPPRQPHRALTHIDDRGGGGRGGKGRGVGGALEEDGGVVGGLDGEGCGPGRLPGLTGGATRVHSRVGPAQIYTSNSSSFSCSLAAFPKLLNHFFI